MAMENPTTVIARDCHRERQKREIEEDGVVGAGRRDNVGGSSATGRDDADVGDGDDDAIGAASTSAESAAVETTMMGMDDGAAAGSWKPGDARTGDDHNLVGP